MSSIKVGDKVYDVENDDWWKTHKELSGVGYVVVEKIIDTNITFSYHHPDGIVNGARMGLKYCALYHDENEIEAQNFGLSEAQSFD